MVSKLSKDQIADFKDAFSLFDQNGDGSISVDELKNVFYSLGKEPSESELQKLIDGVDVDGNGKLEESEFLHLMAGVAQNTTPEEEMKEAFKVFDRDGNGYVSAKELRHAMTTYGQKMSEKECENMLKEADINGDGQLDYNEFVIMMLGDQHLQKKQHDDDDDDEEDDDDY